MTNARSNLTNFTLILGLLLGSWLLLKQTEIKPISSPYAAHFVDSYAQNIMLKQFDKSGALNQTLEATRLEHYPWRDMTLVMKPQMMIKQNETWFVRADYAKATEGGHEITLWQNVVLKQPQEGGNTTSIFTSRLTYLPKANIISTKESIHIKQPGFSIAAIGMRADLNKKTVKLSQHVLGHYEPQTT